jgi:hypothetical protein
VVAIALFLATRYGVRSWDNQVRVARDLEKLSFATAARRPAASAVRQAIEPVASRLTVQRDEFGRVTRVSAGRPRAVLEELCRLASPSGSCAATELRHTEPSYPGHRIGRFTASEGGALGWVVRIRLDRASRRWFTGTGLRPIEPIPDDGKSPIPGISPGWRAPSMLSRTGLPPSLDGAS